MYRVICLAIGYAIGLLQTAYIVGRLNGIDIREYGSKNAGATNAVRVMGAKAGLLVFAGDILKAVVGFMLCKYIFAEYAPAPLYGGLGVILGHCFPFYLGFKGGKGMASMLAIILLTDPIIALVLFIMGIIIVTITKYISAASMAITLLFPAALLLFKYPSEMVTVSCNMTLIILFMHRGNISRLFSGTENKFTFRKQ